MCSSIQICKNFLESAKIWDKNIHKTLEFFSNLFHLLRFNEKKKELKIFGTGNFQSSQFVDTLMKNLTLLPYNICFLTLILGISRFSGCFVWCFSRTSGWARFCGRRTAVSIGGQRKISFNAVITQVVYGGSKWTPFSLLQLLLYFSFFELISTKWAENLAVRPIFIKEVLTDLHQLLQFTNSPA